MTIPRLRAETVGEAAACPDREDIRISDKDTRRFGAMRHRVFWELRHARLRLALAQNDLAWAQELLARGDIAPDGALSILDETMDRLGEDRS